MDLDGGAIVAVQTHWWKSFATPGLSKHDISPFVLQVLSETIESYLHCLQERVVGWLR